jgi:hypothetical protein
MRLTRKKMVLIIIVLLFDLTFKTTLLCELNIPQYFLNNPDLLPVLYTEEEILAEQLLQEHLYREYLIEQTQLEELAAKGLEFEQDRKCLSFLSFCLTCTVMSYAFALCSELIGK